MCRLLALLTPLLTLALAAAATAAPVLGPQAYYAQPLAGPVPEKTEPVNVPAHYTGPELRVESAFVGRPAIEPTIALDQAGNAYFPASYFEEPGYGVGGHSYLMKSTDGGRTWQDIEPATQGKALDPPRDMDPWVYADPDFNRIFDIGLLMAGSYLSYSDDGGETWQTSAVSDPGVNDHQSIVSAVAPDNNTLLAPLDPAFPKLLYYCVNEITRTGCALSRDGGRAWIPTGGSAYLGAGVNEGDEGVAGPVCSALTGHLQSDLEGRVMQPAGHCGQPYLAVTEDGGATWEQHLVSRDIRAADTHTEMYADTSGNYYYVWTDPVHFLPWMATSKDHGETWSTPVNVAPPGVHAVNFPTIVAGEPGRVAIAFSGTTDPDEESVARPWNQYVAVSTNALDREPLFLSTIANQKGDPIHRGRCRGRCGGIFDFADIQLSPADGTFWATSSDSCTEETGCNDTYEGDLPASQTPGEARGFVVRQAGGPKLVGPLEPFSASKEPPLPPGPAAQPDAARPRVRLGISRRSFRVARPQRGRPARTAATFRVRVSESATLELRIDRMRGRRARRVGALRSTVATGLNRLRFTGRVGRRRLTRGLYRATAIVRDSAGNVGRSKPVTFRVR